MAGKQYEVVRDFRRVDPKTGDSTAYKAGDVYSGSVDQSLLDSAGPDGKGPLLAEKNAPAPSDSSSKEKS